MAPESAALCLRILKFTDVVTWLRQPGRRTGPDASSDLVRERPARIRLDLELVHAYLMRAVDEIAANRESGAAPSPALRIHLNTLKIVVSELSFRSVDRIPDAVRRPSGTHLP